MASENLLGRITVEPGKRGGKPCIRGMRITVGEVLALLASGMTREQILADYADLEARDFDAALLYASQALDGKPVAAE